jgi:UDP-N-acetylglucosamine 1-carboxyvinyltransferase
MASFEIYGGKPLKGELIPQGAKNEALQVLCAPLLTEEKVTISNIPDIVDVNKLIALLQTMGVKVEKVEKGTYIFQAKDIDLKYLESEDFKMRASSLRGSIMIVGPLLARYGVGFIPKPGGDKIGRRRLDTHFEGFTMLGAKFNYDAGEHFYSIEGKNLKGTYIHLDEASVTGTANILMAAVMAEGETTFYNAACEPYIQQLCKMLNSMGANITGIGSNMLIINGVKKLGLSLIHI